MTGWHNPDTTVGRYQVGVIAQICPSNVHFFISTLAQKSSKLTRSNNYTSFLHGVTVAHKTIPKLSKFTAINRHCVQRRNQSPLSSHENRQSNLAGLSDSPRRRLPTFFHELARVLETPLAQPVLDHLHKRCFCSNEKFLQRTTTTLAFVWLPPQNCCLEHAA